MIRIRKLYLALLLTVTMLVVGGCTGTYSNLQLLPSFPSFPSFPSLSNILPDVGSMECSTVSPKALKRVNWTRVPKVNIRIRNDEYEPMIVHMTQGWPYVFRIRNRDQRAHTFNAEKFLRSMAVIRLTIAGERQNETCVSSIEVPGGTMAELHLVATIDGHYEFKDAWLPAASLLSGGADGVIIVEERLKAERD